MENAITVNHLVKQYKEHTAVNGISFEVGRGEFFSLLGENGAGKTTTINILCTILDKTAGRVNIYNHELGVDDDAIRNLIGIVFQNSVLDRELTVKENLFTRGSYYGLNRKQVLQRIEPEVRPALRRPAAQGGHRPGPDQRAEDPIPGRAHHRPGS